MLKTRVSRVETGNFDSTMRAQISDRVNEGANETEN